MDWGLFVGPAIIAAIVSAAVTVAGWYVQWRSTRQLEISRRQERVTDVQTALLAEIRSNAHHLKQYDPHTLMASVKQRMAANGSYKPFVPKETGSPVFSAVVQEISILPTVVIDPVVLFYTQQEAISHFADDLRGSRFLELEKDQMIQMLDDYMRMKSFARDLADVAITALETSLGISRSAADPSGLRSASDGEQV